MKPQKLDIEPNLTTCISHIPLPVDWDRGNHQHDNDNAVADDAQGTFSRKEAIEARRLLPYVPRLMKETLDYTKPAGAQSLSPHTHTLMLRRS